MKKRLLLSVAVLLAACLTLSAQIRLKVMDAGGSQILGESDLEGYENQIVIGSYSQGIASCASAGVSGKATNCQATISDLNLMIQMDRSMIPLKEGVLTGEILQSVELSLLKNSGDGVLRYYILRMEDVRITSLQESGSDGAGLPFISLSLNGARIAWAYYRQKDDGTLEPASSYGWDVAKNKAWNYVFN
jgi:type VI protein secretion system component Hcp